MERAIIVIIATLSFIDLGCGMNPLKKFFYKFKDENESESLVKPKRELAKCDEDQLMLQLAHLGVSSPDRIVSMTTAGDLAGLCKKVNVVRATFVS